MLKGFRQFLFGLSAKPLPSNRPLPWISFFLSLGLGVDALSSVCYGPEASFVALGSTLYLMPYLIIAMIFTLFILALGVSQMLALFPRGDGYLATSRILHPYVGLISGTALLLDYALTITVSIVCATDVVFSLLPTFLLPLKIGVEVAGIFLLLTLNIRGVSASVQFLQAILIGFLLSHVSIILYGLITHERSVTTLIPESIQATQALALNVGVLGMISFSLRAYVLGASTYTGLEAVTEQDDLKLGGATRILMQIAFSLSILVAGILLLYLFWQPEPLPGKTLNAIVFQRILGDHLLGQLLLAFILIFEAALLLLAANVGFKNGPLVLAAMAGDSWAPNRFRDFSNHLVKQNGLLVFGVLALTMLLLTQGILAYLIVLYSVNVFLTLSLSLFAMASHWGAQRKENWLFKMIVSSMGTIIASGILLLTLYYQFLSGGLLALLIVFCLSSLLLMVKRHYWKIKQELTQLDQLVKTNGDGFVPLAINPAERTAVVVIDNLTIGMNTVLNILRLFPHQFRNFVFLSVGAAGTVVDGDNATLESRQAELSETQNQCVRFCNQHDYPAAAYITYGTDVGIELKKLVNATLAKYPNAIFFAARLILTHENILTRFLHNQTPLILQQHLHHLGKELVILPVRIFSQK